MTRQTSFGPVLSAGGAHSVDSEVLEQRQYPGTCWPVAVWANRFCDTKKDKTKPPWRSQLYLDTDSSPRSETQ